MESTTMISCEPITVFFSSADVCCLDPIPTITNGAHIQQSQQASLPPPLSGGATGPTNVSHAAFDRFIWSIQQVLVMLETQSKCDACIYFTPCSVCVWLLRYIWSYVKEMVTINFFMNWRALNPICRRHLSYKPLIGSDNGLVSRLSNSWTLEWTKKHQEKSHSKVQTANYYVPFFFSHWPVHDMAN